MKKKHKKTSVGNTYDIVFRTMITDSSRFAISLINEMFGKQISLNAEMVSFQNEMFLADNEERVSDSERQFGEDDIRYHTECESVAGDSGILIRLFEYGSKKALANRQLDGNTLYVTFPMTGVLYLRSTVSTPDKMQMVVKAPDSEEALHLPVYVIKVKDYSLEEIIRRELWFLFPFVIFNYENQLKSKVPDRVAQAETEVLDALRQIKEELNRLNKEGRIDVYERRLAERMVVKVVNSVANKSEKVTKGVICIMGGEVLDYEEKRILRRGEKRGLKLGVRQGVVQGQDALVNAIHELKSGKTPDDLSREGVDKATIQRALSCL